MHRFSASVVISIAATALGTSPAAASDGAPAQGAPNAVSATLQPLPPVPQPESQLTLYTGFYSASDGYDDRFVAGGFYDRYAGATGLHADVVYVNREENAGYIALGVSRKIEGLGRVKLMAGTSTRNDSIFPSLLLNLGLEASATKDLIVRPSVTYRRYRNDRYQVAPEIQLAYYFGGNRDGYFVGQVDGGLFFANGGNTGWSLGGGLTNVRKDGLRIGLAARSGRMAYDSVLGTQVGSKFYGGGPNIGYRFQGGQEVFIRADVSRNDFYTVAGAFVGFKTTL